MSCIVKAQRELDISLEIGLQSYIDQLRKELYELIYAEMDPCDTPMKIEQKARDFIHMIFAFLVDHDLDFVRRVYNGDTAWISATEFFYYLYFCRYMDGRIHRYYWTCLETYDLEGATGKDSLEKVKQMAGLTFVREIIYLTMLNFDSVFITGLHTHVTTEGRFYENVLDRVHEENIKNNGTYPMLRALVMGLSTNCQSRFPFINEYEGRYTSIASKYIAKLTMYIPFIIENRECEFWRIASQYTSLNILDPTLAYQQQMPKKVYVYLRFFTLTHLVLVYRDVRKYIETKKASVVYNKNQPQ